MVKSILDPWQSGLFYFTGLHGRGKTHLAMTAENPKLTVMLDFDYKASEKARALGIAYYSAANLFSGPLSYDIKGVAAFLEKTINGIPEGTKHVIIDNVSNVEESLGLLVAKDPTAYGLIPSNVSAGRYGGVNPGIGKIWTTIRANLEKKGVQLITVIAHMSQPWVDGKPVPNRYSGKGNRALRQLSNLSLILVDPDEPPVPAAIVAKRQVDITTYNDETGEFVTISPFPPRFPIADWKHMKAYFDTPMDYRKPRAGEAVSAREIAAYGDFFSPEQIELMKIIRSYSEEDEDAPLPATTNGKATPTSGPGAFWPLAAERMAKTGYKFTTNSNRSKMQELVSNGVAGWDMAVASVDSGAFDPTTIP